MDSKLTVVISSGLKAGRKRVESGQKASESGLNADENDFMRHAGQPVVHLYVDFLSFVAKGMLICKDTVEFFSSVVY